MFTEIPIGVIDPTQDEQWFPGLPTLDTEEMFSKDIKDEDWKIPDSKRNGKLYINHWLEFLQKANTGYKLIKKAVEENIFSGDYDSISAFIYLTKARKRMFENGSNEKLAALEDHRMIKLVENGFNALIDDSKEATDEEKTITREFVLGVSRLELNINW